MTRGIPPDDRRCTAKSKRHGGRCGQASIKGKDKCRFHGGKTPIKHGRRSKYPGAHPEFKTRIAGFLKNKEELVNIENDIATLRSMVDMLMSKIQTRGQRITLKRLQEFRGLAELLVRAEREIVNAIRQMNTIQKGDTHTIKFESVQLLTEQIIEVIVEEVPDERVRARIADRIEKLRS